MNSHEKLLLAPKFHTSRLLIEIPKRKGKYYYQDKGDILQIYQDIQRLSSSENQ